MKELKFDQFDGDSNLIISICVPSVGNWKVYSDPKDQLLWKEGDLVEAVATGETFFRKSGSKAYCFWFRDLLIKWVSATHLSQFRSLVMLLKMLTRWFVLLRELNDGCGG